MRVILEVVSGPGQGRKVPLRAGQRLQVGRTEFADLTLAGDGHMSSLHFALETSIDGCQVEDLGSSNGTFVNGERVEEAEVGPSDELRVGTTRFLMGLADRE